MDLDAGCWGRWSVVPSANAEVMVRLRRLSYLFLCVHCRSICLKRGNIVTVINCPIFLLYCPEHQRQRKAKGSKLKASFIHQPQISDHHAINIRVGNRVHPARNSHINILQWSSNVLSPLVNVHVPRCNLWSFVSYDSARPGQKDCISFSKNLPIFDLDYAASGYLKLKLLFNKCYPMFI